MQIVGGFTGMETSGVPGMRFNLPFLPLAITIERRPLRWRTSLRSSLVLIALLACGLGGYRHYGRYVQTTKKTYAKAYPVEDLLPGGPGGGPSGDRTTQDFTPLIRSIRAEVLPESWEGQGGAGNIVPFELNDSLIVRTSEVGHERLLTFLRQRRVRSEAPALRTR